MDESGTQVHTMEQADGMEHSFDNWTRGRMDRFEPMDTSQNGNTHLNVFQM